MGLHGPLPAPPRDLQLGHLSDVLPVGVAVLGLLLVSQLADVVGRFLRVEAGHAQGAMVGDLVTKIQKVFFFV